MLDDVGNVGDSAIVWWKGGIVGHEEVTSGSTTSCGFT